MFKTDNPWDEDDLAPATGAVKTILETEAAVRAATEALPVIQAAAGPFLADLEVIRTAIGKNPAVYRANRKLTAVHLPVISSSLREVLDMKAAGADGDRLRDMAHDIASSFACTAEIRTMIEDGAQARIEADLDLVSPEDGDAPDEGRGARLAGRARGFMSQVIEKGRAQIEPSAEALRLRAQGGIALTRIIATSYARDGIDYAFSPVTDRARAAVAAMARASGSSMFSGLFMTILFPPAAPFVAGLAFLEAPELYASEKEAVDRLRQDARAARNAARDKDIGDALDMVRRGSPLTYIETPCLYLTMNLLDGSADGVVLRGRNLGKNLSALSPDEIALMLRTAPDRDTKAALTSWQRRPAVSEGA